MLSENRESSNIYGVVGVKAGGKNDPKDATGIAHYLEHVLFKGTQELGTTDYENEKVYLDSISKLYENLSKTNSQEKRSSIQKKSIEFLSKPHNMLFLMSLTNSSNKWEDLMLMHSQMRIIQHITTAFLLIKLIDGWKFIVIVSKISVQVIPI